ncbi:MAG: serine/threonine-protein kinase [Anaerolineae bacterium]|jgi:serine/threonine protein kinase
MTGEQILQVGAVLENRYRLISEGTSQDLGMIYKARDLQDGRVVVLLVLSPDWPADAETVRRLSESQRLVSSLASPGLVPFEHVGLSDGHLYLVRSHKEGQTLADLLAQRGRLGIEAAIEIAIRLSEALAPAHRAGLVHGSLSPHSVLLTESGEGSEPPGRHVVLVDVGLMPALRPTSVAQGLPWGRLPYLSPEQAAGRETQPASDVYLIGCLLYEMLAGRPPFRDGDPAVLAIRHLRHEPPALQILVPQVPPALAEIVHTSLAKEPAARYRNASQFAHILRSQLRPQRPPRQPEPSTAGRAPEPEHLVVPPPPASSPAPTWTSDRIENWSDEPASVDWLMIALLVAALIAVLGLIPLWRTVYQRYAAPESASTPASSPQPGNDLLSIQLDIETLECQTKQHPKLDEVGFVWYHSGLIVLGQTGHALTQELSGFGSPAYGSGRQSVVNCVCIL